MDDIQQLLTRAESGDAESQKQLGDCYRWAKQGARKDCERAVVWYQKAAAQQLPSAICALGDCYWSGDGVVKDQIHAYELILKAATMGDAEAQYGIARDCEDRYCETRECGDLDESDRVEAVQWYEKAALQGHADAEFELGKAYLEGWGVEINASMAVKWLRSALEHGRRDAKGHLTLALEECSESFSPGVSKRLMG